jgi:hypothetical protein
MSPPALEQRLAMFPVRGEIEVPLLKARELVHG